MYERSVLILDSPLCELGEMSLGLISLGLRPLYATDFEELLLLARERRRHVGALLAPADLLAEMIEPIRRRLLEPLGLPMKCVIAASRHPGEERLRQLASAGVSWRAFDAIAPRDLRFLVALALSAADKQEARRAPRLPCDLSVEMRTDHRTMRTRMIEISTGGAFLALRAPLPPETRIQLGLELGPELGLQSTPLALPARVAWRTAIDGGGAAWLESGMGVEFLQPPPEAREQLAAFTAKQLGRYSIAAAPPPSTGASS